MLFNQYMIALSLSLIVACGCYAPDANVDNGKPWSYAVLPHHDPRYGIGFYDDTGNNIEGVRFEFQFDNHAYYCPAGYFHQGQAKEDRGGPDPIPAEGTVYWQTADGVKHEQHVSPAAAVKNQRTFDGSIWFKIGPNGVLVESVTKAEAHDRAEHLLPEVP